VSSWFLETVYASISGWDRIATRLHGEQRTARWLVRQAMHEGVHHLADIRRIGEQTTETADAQEERMGQSLVNGDLRQFAIQVHQIGFSLNGGVGERECLDLSERMLAAVKQAEARMAS
jgi:hypothetical protein